MAILNESSGKLTGSAASIVGRSGEDMLVGTVHKKRGSVRKTQYAFESYQTRHAAGEVMSVCAPDLPDGLIASQEPSRG